MSDEELTKRVDEIYDIVHKVEVRLDSIVEDIDDIIKMIQSAVARNDLASVSMLVEHLQTVKNYIDNIIEGYIYDIEVKIADVRLKIYPISK